MATAFLLTGPPGVGKTGLIRELLRALDGPAEGFFTAEIREGDQRVGFAIEDLDGRRGMLARAAGTSGPRVGRYRVDVAAVDRIGVAALERALASDPPARLLVIDEIGKMEACSDRFRAAVERALGAPNLVIVGTILQARHAWIDRVKADPAVTLLRLTAGSRDAVLADLLARTRALLGSGTASGQT
jgi:nucleoside-triphosphatase